MGKLTNQVAVVTGASKGIGAAIAKALAAEGDFRKWIEGQSPLSRVGQPDDIAPAASTWLLPTPSI